MLSSQGHSPLYGLLCLLHPLVWVCMGALGRAIHTTSPRSSTVNGKQLKSVSLQPAESMRGFSREQFRAETGLLHARVGAFPRSICSLRSSKEPGRATELRDLKFPGAGLECRDDISSHRQRVLCALGRLLSSANAVTLLWVWLSQSQHGTLSSALKSAAHVSFYLPCLAICPQGNNLH